jgi:hypothetical protein
MTDLPAYLQNRPFQSVTDRLGDSLGSGTQPLLSIKGGRFTLIDPAGQQQPVTTADKGIPYIDVVVIDSLERYSKIYYDHAYDPVNPGPPTCFSDNGIAPSRNASKPQSPTCPSCRWFAWGSAVSKVDSSRATKACVDYQKLALMVPGMDGIYLLRVPPNSLRNCREYNARFRGSGTDIADVVTRISFEKDVLGTLNFQGVSYIDEATATTRNAILTAKKTDTLVGRDDKPIAGDIQIMATNSAVALTTPEPQDRVEKEPEPLQIAPKPRGRPRRPVEPAPQGAPQALNPPFPTQSNPVPPETHQRPSFGVVEGSKPNPDLERKLTSFFDVKH